MISYSKKESFKKDEIKKINLFLNTLETKTEGQANIIVDEYCRNREFDVEVITDNSIKLSFNVLDKVV